MTKFEHAGDPGFTAIAGELSRWIKDLTACEEQGESMQDHQYYRSSLKFCYLVSSFPPLFTYLYVYSLKSDL